MELVNLQVCCLLGVEPTFIVIVSLVSFDDSGWFKIGAMLPRAYLHYFSFLISLPSTCRWLSSFIQLPMRSTTKSHYRPTTDADASRPLRVSAVTDAVENSPLCLFQWKRLNYWCRLWCNAKPCHILYFINSYTSLSLCSLVRVLLVSFKGVPCFTAFSGNIFDAVITAAAVCYSAAECERSCMCWQVQ